MWAIFKRELKSYYQTPSAYIFMGTFLLLSGVLFTTQNVFAMNKQYAEFLGSLILIFVLVVPLLTMKVFSEEKKSRTDQLLLTAPVTPLEIVIGKFLAPLTVFFFTLAITFLYPLLLSFHGNLEVAKIIGTYIGFFLLGASFITLGILVSASTESMASAAIISFCAIILTWFADFLVPIVPTSPLTGALFAIILIFIILYRVYKNSGNLVYTLIAFAVSSAIVAIIYFARAELYFSLIAKTISWISLTTRFSYFPLGIIRLADVVYYISFSALILFVTSQQIEKRRWSKEA